MEAEICRTFGLSCFLASFPKELVSARGGAPALPRYFATILAWHYAPMESPSGASSGDLTKDPSTQTKLGFNDKVKEIMGHDRVEPGRGIHLYRWQARPVDRDPVALLTRPMKLDFHVGLFQ